MQFQGFGVCSGFLFLPFFFLSAGSKTKTEYQQACLADPAGKAHVVKRLGFTGRASRAHSGGPARALCAHGPAAQLLKARRPMRGLFGGAPPAVPLKRWGWSC